MSTLKKTALVVIDLQKGIVGMETKPYDATSVVNNSVKLIQTFRSLGASVFLVHVDFLGGDSLQPISDIPMISSTRPAWWAEFVEALDIQKSDILITKRQWGAFHGTELDLQLRRRDIDTIVLCGIATSIGVESTARQAYELGYNQIFAEDAMASRTEEEHHSTIVNIFPRIGQVKGTNEIISLLSL